MNVYQIVTDRILSLLDQGVIPWRATWSNGSAFGQHRNASTGHYYRGINALMTFAVATKKGYSSPLWVTFKQALALGGNVKRGEKATPIIYAAKYAVADERAESGERFVPFMRQFSLFNAEQCDGLPADLTVTEAREFSAIAECERIVAGMPKAPAIEHSATIFSPLYNQAKDIVVMPARERFESEAFYYTSLFHELAHSTAHTSRLDRPEAKGKAFGCTAYAKEELVAEIAAAFLCAKAGIEQATLADTASYLGSWMKQLQNDPRLIVSAAAQAQKAADIILDTKTNESARADVA